MNNAMSNDINNLYLLTAILVSIIIHLILLIVTEISLSNQIYSSSSSDIEISFITPTPNNFDLSKKLIAKPIEPSLQKVIEPSLQKVIEPSLQKVIEPSLQKVIEPSLHKRIKKNAASVKATSSVKKITTIDSKQILFNIKQLIPNNIKSNSISKKIRRKKISSSSEDYEYRLYFEAWRQKVERIGALNYPEAAKSGIFGSLRLTVSLTQAGKIENIIIDKSSGYTELDKAAISIVEMGSPYAKFSNRMRNEVDIIHITRTWKFTDGNKFSSK